MSCLCTPFPWLWGSLVPFLQLHLLETKLQSAKRSFYVFPLHIKVTALLSFALHPWQKHVMFFSITSAERRNLYYMQRLVSMNDPILIFLNSHVWIFSCSWKRGNWQQPTRPYSLTSPLINSHHWDMKITARSPFHPLMWLFTVQRCVGIKNSFLRMKIRAYKLVHFLKLLQTDVLIMNVWSWLSDINHSVRRTNKYHIIRPNFCLID